jgi:hypothetical protein
LIELPRELSPSLTDAETAAAMFTLLVVTLTLPTTIGEQGYAFSSFEVDVEVVALEVEEDAAAQDAHAPASAWARLRLRILNEDDDCSSCDCGCDCGCDRGWVWREDRLSALEYPLLSPLLRWG